MECLGACVNAPMVLIDKDPLEDLDAEKIEKILCRLSTRRTAETRTAIGAAFV